MELPLILHLKPLHPLAHLQVNFFQSEVGVQIPPFRHGEYLHGPGKKSTRIKNVYIGKCSVYIMKISLEIL